MNSVGFRSIAIALVALLLGGGSGRAASLKERTGKALVTVRIYDGFGLPVDDITAARAEADRILREAGIEPVWLHCSAVAEQWRGSRARCEMGVGPDEIVVRLLRSSPPDSASGRVPLGEALIDREAHTGSLATVFADRVATTSDRAGANPRGVLGRVIAHEIGHLLLGSNQHAAHGVMRAIWTDLELRRALGLEWHFSASEARRMHAGIVERAERAGM
jgi:hypothetical protein